MTGKSLAPDVAIIGAGHNGLVCAAYLARRGLSVALFERRGVIGGAAVTEEFVPGFRNSSASYTVSLLHPKIIRELRLAEHGLRLLARPLQNFLPLPNGDILLNDDFNHRVCVVDPATNRIVWQYGHTGKSGTAAGYLNDPDGVDLVPPDSLLAIHAATMGEP